MSGCDMDNDVWTPNQGHAAGLGPLLHLLRAPLVAEQQNRTRENAQKNESCARHVLKCETNEKFADTRAQHEARSHAANNESETCMP